jgi:uncharacterized membrane-anchored protein YhcB (DUF1043 family)
MKRKEDGNDIDTIIDRSFIIYQNNSRNLERIFAILCGAGLIFFFVAVLPYFFIQYEKQRVSDEYNNTLVQINQTRNAIDNINTKLDRMSEIDNEDIPRVKRQLSEINTRLNEVESRSTIHFPEEVEALRKNLTNQQQELEDTEAKLGNELNTLKSNRTNFEKELNRQENITLPKLEKRQISLGSELRNLTSQWENIQSPFGEVPTGFRDLVAVFPFSLSVGFLIYSHVFSKTMDIRRFLHYLNKKKNNNKLFKDSELDKEIAFTSPLWIDPINTEQNKVLSFLTLIVPFIIFVASIAMILYSWNAEGSDPVLTDAYRMAYYIVNVLGFGFFAYGYWHIINELRRYSNKLDSLFQTRD